jgi:hypothetical protein
MRLRTTRCERANHPEFDLEVGRSDASMTAGLVDWLETSVHGGMRYQHGENIQFASAVLQVRGRGRDFALFEPQPGSLPIVWVDSVVDAVTQTMRQRASAESVGLEDDLDFPHPLRIGFICSRAVRGKRVGLIRNEPMERDTGWCVMCIEQDHDHTNPDEIEHTTVYELGVRIPEFLLFQGMPIKTAVLVGGGKPVQVFFDRKKLPIKPGSMLERMT